MTDEQLQLWLPFDYPQEKTNQELDFSTLPYFQRAKSDNQKLMNLQYEYKVKKNKKALENIFIFGLEICEKFISSETHRNKHIKYMSLDSRKEKAVDAVAYVVSSYLRKPAWFIQKSFTGYLYRRVLHELYYQRKVDKIVDFVDFSLLYKEGEDDE